MTCETHSRRTPRPPAAEVPREADGQVSLLFPAGDAGGAAVHGAQPVGGRARRSGFPAPPAAHLYDSHATGEGRGSRAPRWPAAGFVVARELRGGHASAHGRWLWVGLGP